MLPHVAEDSSLRFSTKETTIEFLPNLQAHTLNVILTQIRERALLHAVSAERLDEG